MTTSKTRRVIFHLDEDSVMSPGQLEARGIFLDGQAHVEGRICFPTVQRYFLDQGRSLGMPRVDTPYQRLMQKLFDHRLALTGTDPAAQEAALDVLQALIHEELQKVWASIIVWRPPSAGDAPSAGDVPWQPPQSSGDVSV